MHDYLSLEEKAYVEQRVQNEKKSAGVVYLLWFVLGGIGAHRFYLGRPISGLILLLTTVLTGWFTFFLPTGLWVLIDLFLINGMLRKNTHAIRQRITKEILSSQTF
ncbi:TM2 domain-containing protein [Dolosicoccus paucivorans]